METPRSTWMSMVIPNGVVADPAMDVKQLSTKNHVREARWSRRLEHRLTYSLHQHKFGPIASYYVVIIRPIVTFNR
jgi:hypothetical protein